MGLFARPSYPFLHRMQHVNPVRVVRRSFKWQLEKKSTEQEECVKLEPSTFDRSIQILVPSQSRAEEAGTHTVHTHSVGTTCEA